MLIPGASSGFGEMTAYALIDAGHTMYASMRTLPDDKIVQAKQADLESVPESADPADVAHVIVELLGREYGIHPLRVTIDPADGGAVELNKLCNRVCAHICRTQACATYCAARGIDDARRPNGAVLSVTN